MFCHRFGGADLDACLVTLIQLLGRLPDEHPSGLDLDVALVDVGLHQLLVGQHLTSTELAGVDAVAPSCQKRGCA